MKVSPLVLLTAAALCAIGAAAQEKKTDPHAMNDRGDHVMGFSQEKTTHHFRLYADGGTIEVEAKDAADTDSRDQIQLHLSHIAKMFAGGNFQAPMLIHDRTPPGVPTLQRLKEHISYRFEKTARGGQVRIQTEDPAALDALYEFLRFQIAEHHTGDPLAVSPAK